MEAVTAPTSALVPSGTLSPSPRRAHSPSERDHGVDLGAAFFQRADELTCRPGSVLAHLTVHAMGDHPSGTAVAGGLVRSTRELGRAALPRPEGRLARADTVRPEPQRRPLDLAPGGVYRAVPVTRNAGGLLHHRFTLTVGPEPGGGLFSVALSRGSPRVGVTHHPALWSPDLPRPSVSPREAAVARSAHPHRHCSSARALRRKLGSQTGQLHVFRAFHARQSRGRQQLVGGTRADRTARGVWEREAVVATVPVCRGGPWPPSGISTALGRDRKRASPGRVRAARTARVARQGRPAPAPPRRPCPTAAAPPTPTGHAPRWRGW